MVVLFTCMAECPITATDGEIGTVADILFDQKNWRVRWLVAKTGGWLLGKRVLVRPSSIVRVEPSARTAQSPRTVVINLSRAGLKASPDLSRDEPVSQQAEMDLYACPGSDPLWGGNGYFGEYSGDAAQDALGRRGDQGDPNLRSCAAVVGYHICAADGVIGHVKDFIFNDHGWSVVSVIIDTGHWRSGKSVLLPPQTISGIGWSDQQVRVGCSRDEVKALPSWQE